jgi:hypothetical protein
MSPGPNVKRRMVIKAKARSLFPIVGAGLPGLVLACGRLLVGATVAQCLGLGLRPRLRVASHDVGAVEWRQLNRLASVGVAPTEIQPGPSSARANLVTNGDCENGDAGPAAEDAPPLLEFTKS